MYYRVPEEVATAVAKLLETYEAALVAQRKLKQATEQSYRTGVPEETINAADRAHDEVEKFLEAAMPGSRGLDGPIVSIKIEW